MWTTQLPFESIPYGFKKKNVIWFNSRSKDFEIIDSDSIHDSTRSRLQVWLGTRSKWANVRKLSGDISRDNSGLCCDNTTKWYHTSSIREGSLGVTSHIVHCVARHHTVWQLHPALVTSPRARITWRETHCHHRIDTLNRTAFISLSLASPLWDNL